MRPSPIYLDHNATTPILPEVADAMRDAALQFPGNPASSHDAGRQARRALEAARQRVGELLGAQTAGMQADRVIFTSGGTESNNLALRGLLPQPRAEHGDRGLLTSAIEHPSVARCAEELAAQGIYVETIGVDERGVIQLAHAEELLTRGADLVSVMLASNETGVLQPIADLTALCKQHDSLLHTDATQAVGKVRVNFRDLGVDALTCTAHKLHGPLGIGALLFRHGVSLTPQMLGGFQQAGLRAGTESVALAVGFAAALEAWNRQADERRERMTALRNRLEQSLLGASEWDDGAAPVVIGASAERLPHTSSIAFPGLDRQALAMALDLSGVACATGSACASGSSEPSPTLLAMGLPEPLVHGAIRFSLGATTTAAEIDEAARRILLAIKQLRRR